MRLTSSVVGRQKLSRTKTHEADAMIRPATDQLQSTQLNITRSISIQHLYDIDTIFTKYCNINTKRDQQERLLKIRFTTKN